MTDDPRAKDHAPDVQADVSHSRMRRRPRRRTPVEPVPAPLFEGSFIVRADGSVEHCSTESRAWLAMPSFASAMATFVAHLASRATDDPSPIPFAPYATASGVRLIGAGTLARFHVRLAPLTTPEPTQLGSSTRRR